MRQKEPIIKMRRKIEKEEGFQDGEVVEVWSKKKILIASVLGIGALGFLGYNLLGSGGDVFSKSQDIHVLGESTKTVEDVELPSREDVESALENAKTTLEAITSDNVTSSQAAIQQIIQNLETAQGGGKDPKDVLCELVCKE